jgi:hypothetical protein
MFGKNKPQVFSVLAFALAAGITCAAWMFLIGIMAWLFNWGHPFVQIAATVYPGYDASFLGSLTGALWGFVDCFIGGAVFAWVYNMFSRNCKYCSK